VVEGARLESVCIRKGTEGSNPSLSASKIEAGYGFLFSRPGYSIAGSCAIGTHEPRQVRKEAALSDHSYVPQGCLVCAMVRRGKHGRSHLEIV
jgi:hypothetical protein